MIPRTVAPIIALSLLLATPAIRAECGPALTGPPCTWGGLAATGPAEPSISLGAGNPVHLATGNKYQQDTDLPANPDAPGLELVRHYNALDPRPSLLGRGWAWSYDTRLYRSDTAWQIIQADGGRLLFPDSGIAPDGSHIGRHGRLDHVDRHHNWFWPDGTAVRFDDQGLLVAIRFPGGESVYVDRHRDDDRLQGAIHRVINDRAQEMVFAYAIADGHARLQSVSTALGTFHYDHDLPPEPALVPAAHRLTGVTRPDGMRRGYLYDASLQNGHPYALTGITLSPGPASADNKDAPRGPLLISSWAYDDQGRAILSAQTTPDGATSHLQLEYRHTASQRAPGLTVITDEKGQETRVHTAILGSRHVVTSVEGAGCTGCAAPGTRADYDRHGRLVSVNGTRLTRTDDGRVHRLQPARSGWPGLGLHYNADGLRERWHSALTGTETMRYNAQGLPVERHFANGDTTIFGYDVQHRPVTMHDRHGDAHTSTRLHWHGHWLTRIEHPAETEVRHYDSSGQVIQREILRDPADTGHRIHLKEHFSYDAQQRLVRHDLPEGGSLHYEWGQGPQITAIHWQDASGRKHQVIASRPDLAGYFWGNGIRLETRADPLHRVRELQLHNGQRLFWSQQLDYDTQQRVSRETIFADTGVTPARH
ncbi:MAG TPA: DUF6531 domain-containing protein, partial [Burkholderiaceae bacterium]|nr:DUF6531 domain-containing protein [Burkholderiaceae bacterium]